MRFGQVRHMDVDTNASTVATSPLIKVAAPGMHLGTPVDRSSRMTTRSPRSSKASATWLPIYPAPPVTSTFMDQTNECSFLGELRTKESHLAIARSRRAHPPGGPRFVAGKPHSSVKLNSGVWNTPSCAATLPQIIASHLLRSAPSSTTVSTSLV